MAISEPVMSLETHKLDAPAIFIHTLLWGGLFLQRREVCFR